MGERVRSIRGLLHPQPDSSWPTIPNYETVREIGRGANGTVFEARDLLLGRSVAIKIWNAKGRARAQQEAAKIANLNHPLVVTTHMFGRVDEHPYAVMELVPGQSGKDWLSSAPDVNSRLEVWRMYALALRYLHSAGVVHGDPHLGNLIVSSENASAFDHSRWGGTVAMKLADAGTSEFWRDHRKFEDREAALIKETASKLFDAERFSSLTTGLDCLPYEQMIFVCEAAVNCISSLNQASYHYSQVAEAVSEQVLKAPFFDLDELYSQVLESSATQVHRVITRLSGRLRGFTTNAWEMGDDKVTDETRQLYLSWRKRWLLRDRTPPR